MPPRKNPSGKPTPASHMVSKGLLSFSELSIDDDGVKKKTTIPKTKVEGESGNGSTGTGAGGGGKKKDAIKKTKQKVLESWEDEASEPDEDGNIQDDITTTTTTITTTTTTKAAISTPSSKPQASTKTLPASSVTSKKASKRVPTSWEDEDDDGDDDDYGYDYDSHHTPISSSAPPPSDTVPFTNTPYPLSTWDSPSPATSTSEEPKRRQPTTDAVARRLISAALGVKPARATAEQREYEASMKAQLRARREKEKMEKEEERKRLEEIEKRRKEVWGD